MSANPTTALTTVTRTESNCGMLQCASAGKFQTKSVNGVTLRIEISRAQYFLQGSRTQPFAQKNRGSV